MADRRLISVLEAALEAFATRQRGRRPDTYAVAQAEAFARDFLNSPEVADVLREPDEMMRRL